MASLLARLKSRKKDKSSGRRVREDETRVTHGQQSEESSDEEVSRAVSEPPPQLPALDFSNQAREVDARVGRDQHAGAAETTAIPGDNLKGDGGPHIGSTRAAMLPENVSIWEPDTTSSAILSQRLQALRLSPSTPEVAHVAVDTPASIKEREDMVQRIAQEIQNRRDRRSLTEDGRRVFSAAGWKDRLEVRDTIDVHTRWLPPVVQASPPCCGLSDRQEHVVRKEHTEYSIVINREVHKYHI